MSLDHVSFSHLSDDGLSQVEWSFWRYGSKLLVDRYEVQERPSTRHKFKTVRKWVRLGNARENSIRKEDVPLTDDIRKEAVEAYAAQMAANLTVVFQGERGSI